MQRQQAKDDAQRNAQHSQEQRQEGLDRDPEGVREEELEAE
ncbi:hypothetical protein [Lysobacter tyrosinilyticus]